MFTDYKNCLGQEDKAKHQNSLQMWGEIKACIYPGGDGLTVT